mmetsp:Transcript_29254/g.42432  ORF Transcript_29254/g.42432 Transcript_29254/m.42432 type:complete len:617 (-) Transcript_29254:321-2171(-)
MQTAGEDSFHSDKGESVSNKGYNTQHAKQMSFIEDEKRPSARVLVPSRDRSDHSNASRPHYVHNGLLCPSLSSHPSERSRESVMNLWRDEENHSAFMPPESSIIPAPSLSASTNHSPHSYRKRPMTMQPEISIANPATRNSPRNFTPFSHAPKSSRHSYPSWYRHNRRYESDDNYDINERDHYRNSHFCLKNSSSANNKTWSSLIPFRSENDRNSQCNYTFDRNSELQDNFQSSYHHPRYVEYDRHDQPYLLHRDRDHKNESRSMQPLPVSSCINDRGYHMYRQDYTYNDDYDDKNNDHPLLRNYNPDFDGCRTAYLPNNADDTKSPRGINISIVTDHITSLDVMTENTTGTLRMPEAAFEANFDVMDPPVTPITQPSEEPLRISPDSLNEYDILMGRGGSVNSQIGNCHFRSLVQDFQHIYLTLKRKDKPLMARSMVLIVRNRGGRFLKKGEKIGEYYEVGDEKAETKACQALREGLGVRATTRKRKEIHLQEREIENETKKMTRNEQGREIESEQSHMSVEEQVIPYNLSMEEDYFILNKCEYPSMEYIGHNVNCKDTLAFQSSSQNESSSSALDFSSTATGEQYQQQLTIETNLSSDEDYQREESIYSEERDR